MGLASRETVAALAVSMATLTVYYRGLHPSLPGGDAGELIVAAHEFGVAHPPGYPTFTLLAKLFMLGLPFNSLAWRVNLLSAVCGAVCAGCLYLLVYRLTRSHPASLLSTCCFCLSPLTWTWSTTAEVFALNNLLLATLLLVAAIFDGANKESLPGLSLMGSFLCGLCLSNQHTSVLYLVCLVPWALYRLARNQLLTLTLIARLSLTLLGGLLPYVYLPVSSYLRVARWTWGDQRTLRGLVTHLLREEYGTWDLLKDHVGQGFSAGLIGYKKHLTSDLSIPVSILAALSFIPACYRYQNSRSSVLALMYMMLVFYILFLSWRANLDIENPLFLRVVERFWIQSDLLVVVLASVTLADITSLISRQWAHRKSLLDWSLAVSIAGLVISGRTVWPRWDQSNNWVVHDFAVQTLMSFPAGSIVLTKGDLPSNSFRYFNLCQGLRPDVTVFDQEILTYEWSLPMMKDHYPGIIFPGDLLQLYSGLRADNRTAFRFKDLIDANYHRSPIFACIGMQTHELSWQESYTLWPFGVCWQVVRKDSTLDIAHWTNVTASLTDSWNHAWSNSNNGSWEEVANSEMWRARTATAYFYLELGLSLENSHHQQAVELLTQSYLLFTRAIEKYRSFPAFWHRNYAIVCERLLRAGTRLDTRLLLEKTISHFTQFIQQVPEDLDSDKIRQAVRALEEHYLNMGGNLRR